VAGLIGICCKSIFDFKPDSISAAEFEELANEVLEKVGLSA
jgi:hypothetical protein